MNLFLALASALTVAALVLAGWRALEDIERMEQTDAVVVPLQVRTRPATPAA